MPKSTATTRPCLVDQQIALVHVGVEEAVAHGVAQERAQRGEAERLEIVARGFQRCVIGDRDAVDPFQRQHAAGRASPIDRRHAEAAKLRRLILDDIVGHLRDGGSLQPHVHLDLDRVRQGLDHGDRAQPPRRRVEALDLARGEEIAVEIVLELLLDAGPQHLDGHVAAHAVVDHHRLVHLGDGGRGNGRAELGEMILQLAAELLLDGLAGLGHGEGRQPVLQVPQIAGELRPDQIGTGGEELAELDVAGAEAGDGARRPGAPWAGWRGTARSAREWAASRRGPDRAQTAPWCPPARSARHAAPARCRRARGGGCCRRWRPWEARKPMQIEEVVDAHCLSTARGQVTAPVMLCGALS